jgi:hypothetical protein
MIETMVTSPKWTLRQWKVVLEDQLGSWMMYIPGMGSADEVQQVKTFKGVTAVTIIHIATVVF